MPRSVMTNQYRVPTAQNNRSVFNRSHGHLSTFSGGELIPILVDDVLPGDTFNCKMDAFIRLSTPIFPVMTPVKIQTFFFFVPMRLVWDNSKKFFGEQTDPGDSIDYTLPQRTTSLDNSYTNSLIDYFGLPIPAAAAATKFTTLPFRAYWLIYDEWFRDRS